MDNKPVQYFKNSIESKRKYIEVLKSHIAQAENEIKELEECLRAITDRENAARDDSGGG